MLGGFVRQQLPMGHGLERMLLGPLGLPNAPSNSAALQPLNFVLWSVALRLTQNFAQHGKFGLQNLQSLLHNDRTCGQTGTL
jgi:hypothetical protein